MTIGDSFCNELAAKNDATEPASPIYVVQEHHASRLHWDLRFEIDGTLKSWALPKGAPRGGERWLAVQVDEHPIGYATFEGTIPKGNYGAGLVKVWDIGTFELESRSREKQTVWELCFQPLQRRC